MSWFIGICDPEFVVATSDPSPESTGLLLDRRYRLIAPLARGGMSVVWRGQDELLGRPVAVKVLNIDPDDPTVAGRVRREAMAIARLSHPHIATVYDYGESTEMRHGSGRPTPYIVMELVDGESLAQVLKRGPMSWPAAVGVCAQVAAALATAHQYGVVHRDITPGNIMLSADGVKVIDFGVAASTGDCCTDGVVFGTPAYLAPERLSGDLAQPATDVYGLGIVLYQSLTGRLPWPGGSTKELVSAHRYVPPAPMPPIAGLPLAVAELCQRCLCVDPGQRPASARAYVTLAEMARYGDRRAPRTIRMGAGGYAATRVLTRFSEGHAELRPTVHEPIDVESSTVPVESRNKSSPTRPQRRQHGMFILPALLMLVLVGCLGLSEVGSSDGGIGAPAPSHRPATDGPGGTATDGPAADEPKLPAVTQPSPHKIGIADAPDAATVACRVSYRTTATWLFGYAALVTLANTSEMAITGWRLQFTLPKGDRINGGWNGQWSQQGRKVTVEDVSYNATLPPGGAISLGFLGRLTDTESATNDAGDGAGSETGNDQSGGRGLGQAHRSEPRPATGFKLNGQPCTAS